MLKDGEKQFGLGKEHFGLRREGTFGLHFKFCIFDIFITLHCDKKTEKNRKFYQIIFFKTLPLLK